MAVFDEVTLALIEFICLFFSLSGWILLKIHNAQPKPFMDEIFHIPQAQKYCNGNFFEWDPMITTLPGLYLSSIGILQPVAWMFDIATKVACSVFWLRSLNIAFAVANVLLLRLISRKLHVHEKDYNDAKSLLTAIALGIFPVLYFFSFLYYTDSGSVFAVLLMYLLSLHSMHIHAALIGVVAIMFRQTNVVWVIFVAGLSLIDTVTDFVQPEKKELTEEQVQSPGFMIVLLKRVMTCLKSHPSTVFNLVLDCLQMIWPYVNVVTFFLMFVYFNGGIVVGAKDDHQVMPHFPQLFYFVSFSTCFAFMHLVSVYKIIDFLKFLIRRPVTVLLFCGISAVLIWQFTFSHRYLLADNRHYTFYVWSKIYRQHDLIRYFLIPCYLYATWSFTTALKHCSGLWKIIYFTCVFVNLVPQMLLEFRYFIVPYLIFRLNMKMGSYIQLTMEILLYLIVNVATIYLFMERPFKWENSPDVQHFMW